MSITVNHSIAITLSDHEARKVFSAYLKKIIDGFYIKDGLLCQDTEPDMNGKTEVLKFGLVGEKPRYAVQEAAIKLEWLLPYRDVSHGS